MPIPKPLKEYVDDINSPSNRVLIVCLISAIMTLAYVIVTQERNKEKIYDKIQQENITLKIENAAIKKSRDSLLRIDLYNSEIKNVELQNRVNFNDSIIQLLQNEYINELKKKR